jgi:hypothetical protein
MDVLDSPITLQALVLVSFDIDGTVEIGKPPGPVALSFVMTIKERGCLIGSASDRTLSDQRLLWQSAGIKVDFVSLKHRLAEATASFSCTRRIHIGDSQADAYYASIAGFEFYDADAWPSSDSPEWIFY